MLANEKSRLGGHQMLRPFTVCAFYSTGTIFSARMSPVFLFLTVFRSLLNSTQTSHWSFSMFVFLAEFDSGSVCEICVWGIATFQSLLQAAGVCCPVLDDSSTVCLRMITPPETSVETVFQSVASCVLKTD